MTRELALIIRHCAGGGLAIIAAISVPPGQLGGQLAIGQGRLRPQWRIRESLCERDCYCRASQAQSSNRASRAGGRESVVYSARRTCHHARGKTEREENLQVIACRSEGVLMVLIDANEK